MHVSLRILAWCMDVFLLGQRGIVAALTLFHLDGIYAYIE
jgi:hypothetical protein